MTDRFAEWMLAHADALAMGIAIVAGVVGALMLVALFRNGDGGSK